MQYQLTPIHCRPWLVAYLSIKLVESHYENDYGGALRRLNAITEQLRSLDPATTPGHVINGLKREELIALNSTLLHELYFASLGGDGRRLPEEIAAAIVRDFGSVLRWRQEFIALAEALAGGSGWVLLTYIPRDGRLVNQSATDHMQSISGGIPILAIDMYEHAYHLDFGANATAYIAAVMRNIDWEAVQTRYRNALKVEPPPKLVQKQWPDLPAMTVEEVKSMLDAGQPIQIIDTRPRHYTTRAQDIMESAVWRDPERVDEWIGELSKSDPVVTFCVYGFHIGCETAETLRKAGFDARYMAGGHYAWKAKRNPVKLFE